MIMAGMKDVCNICSMFAPLLQTKKSMIQVFLRIIIIIIVLIF